MKNISHRGSHLIDSGYRIRGAGGNGVCNVGDGKQLSNKRVAASRIAAYHSPRIMA